MVVVSIICPVYNEERFIAPCIDSVLAQDYPSELWELLLVDGMSSDKTRQQITPYLKAHENIHLIDNPYRTAPYAMNIGIRHAQGQYICRIDAHADYETNYVSTLLHYMETLPDATNVGAACLTQPSDTSAKSQAIAIACSHPLGVGNSTFRTTSVQQPTIVDTVPFGFWRKSLFDVIGGFDEQLSRNQDDEFNARTIQNGGHIYIVPNLLVTYYARNSIKNVANMFYQYGLYKPLVNKKLKHPATIRQFVPLLFVLGLIAGLPLAFINSVFCYCFVLCIAIYTISISAVGLQKKNLFLPIVFPVIHLSYGWGYLYGIIKIIFNRSFDVKINR